MENFGRRGLLKVIGAIIPGVALGGVASAMPVEQSPKANEEPKKSLAEKNTTNVKPGASSVEVIKDIRRAIESKDVTVVSVVSGGGRSVIHYNFPTDKITIDGTKLMGLNHVVDIDSLTVRCVMFYDLGWFCRASFEKLENGWHSSVSS